MWKKIGKIVIGILLGLILLLAGLFFYYVSDYYKADSKAVEILESKDSSIKNGKDCIIFYPNKQQDKQTAFIFYPGGKVESLAYVPILKQLSEQGITCLLVKMPFHLAVFGINKADQMFGQLPDIKNWYIGGHSLGGAMAGSYAGKHEDKLKGIILLGAYTTSKTNLPILELYGSEDHVLDKSKLNPSADQIEIQGGNHAGYGNYGKQKGDGAATITRAEQQKKAVEAVVNFVNAKNQK
jgi:Predicted hydrolases or acyltransferases (alpha/beta hydrolase superfamily)